MKLRLVLAMAVIVVSVTLLEAARTGVTMTHSTVGDTPVVQYARDNADGPVVIVAHGFAGSEQMMQGYALPLARAGYRVFAFDLLGHGRNPVPMSGDVTRVDGTTRLLVEQTAQVIEAVAAGEDHIGLLGHSMATDILIRVAETRDDIGPIVLISAFSQAITAETPDTLLFVTGAWEPALRQFAVDATRLVDPAVAEGEIADNGPILRRAVVAPFAEHVSVLHSRAGRRAALDWMDMAFGRASDVTILPTGWAILGLLIGLVLIFRPVCALLPQQAMALGALSRRQLAGLMIIPLAIAPLCALLPLPDVLPVLVADYLMLHLLVFGGVQLTLLRMWRVPFGPMSWPALGVLLIGCAVFGYALNRYAANFWPTGERIWIIAIMMIGAVPFMVADAVIVAGQKRSARLLARASVLASLGIAVALDFDALFFLILIAPVLVLFYLVFGTMGREAAQRAGPGASGLALGLVLAWALGVSFPLFQA